MYTCASSDFYDSLGHASTDRVTRKPVCPRWELQPDGQLQRRRSGELMSARWPSAERGQQPGAIEANMGAIDHAVARSRPNPIRQARLP